MDHKLAQVKGIRLGIALVALLCAGSVALAGPRSPLLEVRLSKAEKDWLEDHPVLRLGTDPSWPPLEWIDDQGAHRGLVADYVQAVQDLLGVTLEPVRTSVWHETADLVQRGEVEVVSALGRTPVRERYLLFTEALIDLPTVLVIRRDMPPPDGLAAMEGMTVAVLQAYAFEEWMARVHPSVNLVPCPDVARCLGLVVDGHADAYVGDRFTAEYGIRRWYHGRLGIAWEVPFINRLRMGVRKDLPQLAVILDKAIATLDAHQRNQIRDRWVEAVADEATGSRLDLRVVGAGLLVALLLAALVLRLRLNARRAAARTARQAASGPGSSPP
jgi:ABC-type amino acid transport substrate-binding protein